MNEALFTRYINISRSLTKVDLLNNPTHMKKLLFLLAPPAEKPQIPCTDLYAWNQRRYIVQNRPIARACMFHLQCRDPVSGSGFRKDRKTGNRYYSLSSASRPPSAIPEQDGPIYFSSQSMAWYLSGIQTQGQPPSPLTLVNVGFCIYFIEIKFAVHQDIFRKCLWIIRASDLFIVVSIGTSNEIYIRRIQHPLEAQMPRMIDAQIRKIAPEIPIKRSCDFLTMSAPLPNCNSSAVHLLSYQL